MSDKGTKGTDKVKFVKLDGEGELSSVFPKGEGTEPETSQPSFLQQPEPHFNIDEQVVPEVPEDAALSKEIDELKPKVEEFTKNVEAIGDEQIDVFRKYISLKEAEVRDLKDQQKQYKSFVRKLSNQVQEITAQNRDLLASLDSRRRSEEQLRRDLTNLKERADEEIARTKNDCDERLRSVKDARLLADDLARKQETWKEQVREDLKRIKLKERELENKYELLKRDMQALLDSKDKHVLELKKKNDALELELESFDERLHQMNAQLGGIDAKKQRLIETLRLALSLLEEIDKTDLDPIDLTDRKKAG